MLMPLLPLWTMPRMLAKTLILSFLHQTDLDGLVLLRVSRAGLDGESRVGEKEDFALFRAGGDELDQPSFVSDLGVEDDRLTELWIFEDLEAVGGAPEGRYRHLGVGNEL